MGIFRFFSKFVNADKLMFGKKYVSDGKEQQIVLAGIQAPVKGQPYFDEARKNLADKVKGKCCAYLCPKYPVSNNTPLE